MFKVEIGLLVAVLVAMNDTSEDDIDEYLNNMDSVIGNTVKEKESENTHFYKLGTVPLSEQRLEFLLHLLDDVRKFV